MDCQCWNCRNPKFATDGFVMPSHGCKTCEGRGYVVGRHVFYAAQTTCPVCSASYSEAALDELEEILRRRRPNSLK